jgi:hypothetical protein
VKSRRTGKRGSRSQNVDHAGWLVTLHSPEAQGLSGKTLEEALAWCPVWLMAPEIGVGPVLLSPGIMSKGNR